MKSNSGAGSGEEPFLLAERARSEGARPTRAVGDQAAHPPAKMSRTRLGECGRKSQWKQTSHEPLFNDLKCGVSEFIYELGGEQEPCGGPFSETTAS